MRDIGDEMDTRDAFDLLRRRGVEVGQLVPMHGGLVREPLAKDGQFTRAEKPDGDWFA